MVRRRGKGKVVLASGTFDLLHLEHVRYLEEAKRAGGRGARLIVLVSRDRTAERRKGRRPVLPEDQRRAIVEALRVVDEAVLGYEEADIGRVIEKIRPDVIALGYDEGDVEEEVRRAIAERGLKVEVVRVGKFGRDELNSSSKIKRRIIESWK